MVGLCARSLYPIDTYTAVTRGQTGMRNPPHLTNQGYSNIHMASQHPNSYRQMSQLHPTTTGISAYIGANTNIPSTHMPPNIDVQHSASNNRLPAVRERKRAAAPPPSPTLSSRTLPIIQSSVDAVGLTTPVPYQEDSGFSRTSQSTRRQVSPIQLQEDMFSEHTISPPYLTRSQSQRTLQNAPSEARVYPPATRQSPRLSTKSSSKQTLSS